MTTIRTTAHVVQDVTFIPRTSIGTVVCSCGWSGDYYPISDSDSFQAHRKAAGASRGYIGNSLRTPDSAVFVKSSSDRCSRGHTGEWRPVPNSTRRNCKGCARELERERRKAERAAEVAA